MISLSNWGSIQLTDASRALMASGATIKFTKIKLGSGTLTNVNTATDLAKPKQLVTLTGLNVSNGVAALTGLLTTDKVNNSFMASEAGVFASDNNGGEILFLVCNDSSPDLIPDKTNPVPSSISYTFNIAANSATADLDNSSLVVLSLLNRHKIDPNAHGAMTSTINDDANPTTNTNDLRTLLSNLAARLKATAGTADWKLTASDLETLNTAVAAINIDQTKVPADNTGTLQILLSEMANRIKTLTEYNDWKDDTIKSLKDVAKWFNDLKRLDSFRAITGIPERTSNFFSYSSTAGIPGGAMNISSGIYLGPGFLNLNIAHALFSTFIYMGYTSTSNMGFAPISQNAEMFHPYAGIVSELSLNQENYIYTANSASEKISDSTGSEYYYLYIASANVAGSASTIVYPVLNLSGFGGLLDD